MTRPLLLTFAVLLGACASSPPARFYTLSAPATAAANPVPAAYTVLVGPVGIPEIVDRPQIVLRGGDNRVEVLEASRWAAPLEGEIARVLADRIGGALPEARVATVHARSAPRPEYRVVVDVQRFETSPASGVVLEALWTVRPATGAPVSGRTVTAAAAGGGIADLVAAHGRALAVLGGEVAQAITVLRR